MPILSAFSATLTSPWRLALLVVAAPLVAGAGIISLAANVMAGGSMGWQILLGVAVGLAGLVSAAFIYAIALKPTRGALLRYVAGWSKSDLVAWGLLVVVLPTVAFAVVMAILEFPPDRLHRRRRDGQGAHCCGPSRRSAGALRMPSRS